MNIDEDTCQWLGCPTPLEMYQHQCAMLEDELIQTQAMLRKARENIAGLVQMNDILSTGKAQAETGLILAMADLSRVNIENSKHVTHIMTFNIIRSQNEHVLRENQRLLLELKVLRGPEP